MGKDRDGSVRARVDSSGRAWSARYKYNGRWWVVHNALGYVINYESPDDAREAAHAMYNVACNGGKHQ